MRVVCLAGGVGGAKLADGLQQILAARRPDGRRQHRRRPRASFADDLPGPRHGPVHTRRPRRPDAGLGHRRRDVGGHGPARRLGEETWFRLGDRDIATHLYRTDRLRRGARPTEVALELATALDVRSTILPMTDQPVRTRVRTADGWLDFQDYFVRLRQEPAVLRSPLTAASQLAAATPEVRDAIRGAEAIVVGPSNPVVSIGPDPGRARDPRGDPWPLGAGASRASVSRASSAARRCEVPPTRCSSASARSRAPSESPAGMPPPASRRPGNRQSGRSHAAAIEGLGDRAVRHGHDHDRQGRSPGDAARASCSSWPAESAAQAGPGRRGDERARPVPDRRRGPGPLAERLEVAPRRAARRGGTGDTHPRRCCAEPSRRRRAPGGSPASWSSRWTATSSKRPRAMGAASFLQETDGLNEGLA